MLDRRHFISLTSMAIIAGPGAARTTAPLDLAAAAAQAERVSGGRFGLAVHDTATGRRFSHRGDERFPLASTFKFLLVAAILARVDQGKERLDRAVPITATDIIDNSPFTGTRVGATATVAELCESTLIFSDNAAANLLLPSIGGPAGLTNFLRRLGDPLTRLDRNEMALGEAVPGDPRDTTSPNAMLADMERILVGNALKPASRHQLTSWLIDNRTGDKRLRAGLPTGWRVGDKTGSAAHRSINDIAIIWPTSTRKPLLVAAYANSGNAGLDVLNAVHAAVARAIAAAVQR